MEFFQKKAEVVSISPYWSIYRDDDYYYKVLQEQNIAAVDGRMEFNLNYMMNHLDLVSGVNTVVDMYYIEELFITYSTKIVEDSSLKKLCCLWGYDLQKWKPFLIKLIQLLNNAKEFNYFFPDLFTYGNILYDIQKNKIHFIDNDGIQIGKNFPHIFDIYSESIILHKDKTIFRKYFNFDEDYFKPDFVALSFYSFFFHYFFGIHLPSLLCNSSLILKETLNRLQIPNHSDFWDSIFNLMSFDTSYDLSPELFQLLCEHYSIKDEGNSRILVPR